MAEKVTIARPYAQAVFELAQSSGEFAAWSGRLELLAAVVSAPELRPLMGHPRVQRDQLAALIIEIGADQLDQAAQNLVKLLVQNNRTKLLPEIALLYEGYRAEAERTVEAVVISAFKMNKAQEGKIAQALKARLGREVHISSRVDETLMGGAVIRAGDLVIDGSVKGQLHKLANALS